MTDNNGAYEREYETIDVTSLTNAGSEPWDPAAETGLAAPDEVVVVGYENADTYAVRWDHLQGAFVFADLSDGTAPASGTDVGELKVRVEGRR